MDSDEKLTRWEPGQHSLGRLCPMCGAPLRDRDVECPSCGGACSSDGAGPGGLLTPFGHGLCALIGVGLLSLSVSVGLVWRLPRAAIVLGPVAAAIVAASLAAGVGRRLAPQWRCSYEHLLLGEMIAGPCAITASLLGLSNPESLVLLWSMVAGATFLLMRRYGYRSRGPGWLVGLVL